MSIELTPRLPVGLYVLVEHVYNVLEKIATEGTKHCVFKLSCQVLSMVNCSLASLHRPEHRWGGRGLALDHGLCLGHSLVTMLGLVTRLRLGNSAWRQLYKNRSSRKIYSQ